MPKKTGPSMIWMKRNTPRYSVTAATHPLVFSSYLVCYWNILLGLEGARKRERMSMPDERREIEITTL